MQSQNKLDAAIAAAKREAERKMANVRREVPRFASAVDALYPNDIQRVAAINAAMSASQRA